MDTLIIVGLGISALVALAIGANDLANSIAPVVGSKILSYKYALLLFFISLSLGALLQG